MIELLLQLGGPLGIGLGVALKHWFPHWIPFLFDAAKGLQKSEEAFAGVSKYLHSLPEDNLDIINKVVSFGEHEAAAALAKRLPL